MWRRTQCTGWQTAVALAVQVALLIGCTSAMQQGQRFADQHRFERAIITGDKFRHVVFRNDARPNGELHVYLDGDGSPFPTPDTVAADPTPRQPLMLHLMALDPSPSVYIGRPCYWGLATDPGCSPVFWTLARFNGTVIDSCSTAIRSELARSGAQHWSVYAHSGGAAIALLIAPRVPGVQRIVTIGPNLDTDAWSALHGYTPLSASENPVKQFARRTEIPTTHYVGSRDLNTPAELVSAAARRVGGEVIVVEDYSHTCCWERLWGSILGQRVVGTSLNVPNREMRPD